MSKESPTTSPRVTIKVSQTSIDEAVQGNSSHCMIADSVKLAVPTAKFVSVDLQTIRWTDPEKGKRYVYLTPRIAQCRLLDFDAGKEFEPFDFQLRYAQVVKSGKGDTGAKHVNMPKRQTTAKGGNGKGKSGGSIPIRIGGQTPPLGPLSNTRAGARREFGLRGMGK